MNKFLTFCLVLLSSGQFFAQCSAEFPELNLGNDTILCHGQNLQLTAQNGYANYVWSNDSVSSTILVNSSGTYTVIGTSTLSSNIIVNGDFEGGTSAASNNFITEYIPGTGGTWGLISNAGQYAISTSPSNVHDNFIFCADHTSGSGNMMIANGASTGNTIVWEQTVTVTPNTNYIFSMWQSSVENTTAPSQLRLFINNDTVSALQVCSNTGCLWTQTSGVWNSGSNTSATLKIINFTLLESGNDFALDDIFFSPICVSSDTITVLFDTLQINAGPDVTMCANNLTDIIASANMPIISWLWNTNETTDQITPTQTGLYYVAGVDENNCTFVDSVNVTIDPMNWQIANVMATTSQCGINDGTVSATVNGNTMLASYLWSGPGQNSMNQLNASSWSGLAPGWYYLEVTSAGCSRYDSIKVIQEGGPNAIISASPQAGYAPLSVNFSNNSSSTQTFHWNFGDGSTWDTTVTSGTTHMFDSIGVYTVAVIAQNGTCTDTAYVQIIVSDPPVVLPVSIETANVFSPNNDGLNDFYSFDLINIKSIQLTIMNRWGNVLVDSDDINFQWNGKLSNGKDAEEGVYFYIYKAVGIQNEALEGHGFIHLVR
jgi:gliding motility-associated-like protein